MTTYFLNKIIDWNIISTNILFIHHDELIPKKVIIFYDSFLLSSISLYMNIFNDVYFIKNIYTEEIVELIAPDLIFEFRCELFLF